MEWMLLLMVVQFALIFAAVVKKQFFATERIIAIENALHPK